MIDVRPIVLDASIGVKWIKPSEEGADQALALLAEHRDHTARIVVSTHFVTETVGVAVRHGGPRLGARTWQLLRAADLTVIGLDDEVVAAALGQCQLLGCCFFDALAPALATMLDATLYSADRCAHERFPGVVLLG
ncbi:MAG: PIN domain-containing protein [Coriobacteriia bacterium]